MVATIKIWNEVLLNWMRGEFMSGRCTSINKIVGNFFDNIEECLEKSWENCLMDSNKWQTLGWMVKGMSQTDAARASQIGFQWDPTTPGSIGILDQYIEDMLLVN
ncbi:hypothetical protein TNCV_5031731 [Trichonephila clavipes]|nr:hypothetical protein TNCV_5031731 [Trichonephila clavipes]